MSQVRQFYPEVRLKTLLAAPGGVSVNTALNAATQNLESIRETCVAEVHHKVHEISEERAGDRKFLYQRSNELFGEAGALGMTELSKVGHSLCALLTREQSATQPEIDVHCAAMRALIRSDLSSNQQAREAVLAGLQSISSRV